MLNDQSAVARKGKSEAQPYQPLGYNYTERGKMDGMLLFVSDAITLVGAESKCWILP